MYILYLNSPLLATFYTLSFIDSTQLTLLTLLTYITYSTYNMYIYIYIYTFENRDRLGPI
jgi:hypothetical protein